MKFKPVTKTLNSISRQTTAENLILLRATKETNQGEFVHKFPVASCCDSIDNPMAKREWRCNV
jgi:hypothetical protein